MTAVCRLGFFKILTPGLIRMANMHHRAKFRANRSNRSGDMAIFQFFKMTTIRHLEFLKVGNFYSWSGSICQLIG